MSYEFRDNRKWNEFKELINKTDINFNELFKEVPVITIQMSTEYYDHMIKMANSYNNFHLEESEGL